MTHFDVCERNAHTIDLCGGRLTSFATFLPWGSHLLEDRSRSSGGCHGNLRWNQGCEGLGGRCRESCREWNFPGPAVRWWIEKKKKNQSLGLASACSDPGTFFSAHHILKSSFCLLGVWGPPDRPPAINFFENTWCSAYPCLSACLSVNVCKRPVRRIFPNHSPLVV